MPFAPVSLSGEFRSLALEDEFAFARKPADRHKKECFVELEEFVDLLRCTRAVLIQMPPNCSRTLTDLIDHWNSLLLSLLTGDQARTQLSNLLSKKNH